MKGKLMLYPFMVATSVLFAQETSQNAFGQRAPTCESVPDKCSPAPKEVPDCNYPPAYNATAAVDVNQQCWKWCGMNYFADVSFLYWYGGEEGLSLASSGVFSGSTTFLATQTTTYFQDFSYKPGFKIGLGLIASSEWVVSAQYTWLRGENTTNIQAGTNGTTAGTFTALSGTPVLLVNDWFLQGTTAGQALSGSGLSSTWKYGLDIIDLTASRPFYQGRSLIVTPFTGLRTAWIRQNMRVALTEAAGLFASALPIGSSPSQPIVSQNYSNGWGIGPRLGIEGDFILPMGFRLEGDIAGSLLYMHYSTLSHSEDRASTSFNAGPYTANVNGYGCLRPVGELSLGAGWGQYIYGRDYHIDFSASYDFNLFWNQNMIRFMLDEILTGTGSSPMNLYFHGLTLTGRFDF